MSVEAEAKIESFLRESREVNSILDALEGTARDAILDWSALLSAPPPLHSAVIVVVDEAHGPARAIAKSLSFDATGGSLATFVRARADVERAIGRPIEETPPRWLRWCLVLASGVHLALRPIPVQLTTARAGRA